MPTSCPTGFRRAEPRASQAWPLRAAGFVTPCPSIGAGTPGAESEQEPSKRRHQRTLFDGVAGLYEASRLGYPSRDIVEFAVTTAGLGTGRTILEVGCGTGQLTESLACFESTRATSLSWPADVRREFTEELRRHLRGQNEVHLRATSNPAHSQQLRDPGSQLLMRGLLRMRHLRTQPWSQNGRQHRHTANQQGA